MRQQKEDKFRCVLWRVWEMHVMDKMILFRACGNLNLCGATEVSSLGTVLTWTILGHALGFIYIGECSEFGTNYLHCF